MSSCLPFFGRVGMGLDGWDCIEMQITVANIYKAKPICGLDLNFSARNVLYV